MHIIKTRKADADVRNTSICSLVCVVMKTLLWKCDSVSELRERLYVEFDEQPC